MNIESVAVEPKRLTIRTDTGHRTTISIPEALREQYIQDFGGAGKFRKNLNEAVREVGKREDLRLGFTLSLAVRMNLDKRLGR